MSGPRPGTPGPRVVAVSGDLMDRSKLRALSVDLVVVPPARFFAESAADEVAAALAPGPDGPPPVVVDLAVVGEGPGSAALARLGALVAAGHRVVGYGSHVDEARLAAARTVGVEAMARSVFFRRLAAGDVIPGQEDRSP